MTMPKIAIAVQGGVVQAVNLSPELAHCEVVVKDYDVDGRDEPGQCVDATGDRCYLLDCLIGRDVALPTPPEDGDAPDQ